MEFGTQANDSNNEVGSGQGGQGTSIVIPGVSMSFRFVSKHVNIPTDATNSENTASPVRTAASPRVVSAPNSMTRSSQLADGCIDSITIAIPKWWLVLCLPLQKFRNRLDPTLANVNHNDVSPFILADMIFNGLGSPFSMNTSSDVIHEHGDLGRDIIVVMSPYAQVSTLRQYLEYNTPRSI